MEAMAAREWTLMDAKQHPRGAQVPAPQEHERTSEELVEFIERESQELLGVSWTEAREMLENGSLAGTAAEAQLSMLAFLMGG